MAEELPSLDFGTLVPISDEDMDQDLTAPLSLDQLTPLDLDQLPPIDPEEALPLLPPLTPEEVMEQTARDLSYFRSLIEE